MSAKSVGAAPPNDDLTDAAYWERLWQRKDAHRWADLRWVRARYSWQALDGLLRRRLPQEPGKQLLELGCATGRWLVYFHRTFGYDVTGCDYSETGCASARETLAVAGIPGQVLMQDMFTLDGAWDVVFSGGLIEHFTDTRHVLAKLASLLRPGGTLVTLVPNLNGVSGLYHRLLKPETFETHIRMTTRELRGWHRDLGLVNVDVGALGSVVPSRFPRAELKRTHPRMHRVVWGLAMGPASWMTERLCIAGLQRLGLRVEAQSFSPYLYADREQARVLRC